MNRSSKSSSSGLLIIEKLPGYFLIACVIASFIALIKIVAPFLTAVFVGAVLVISFYPVYKKILKWLRGWKRTSSLISTVLVFLIIVIPITLFITFLVIEAKSTYEIIKFKIESGLFDKYFQWTDGGFFYDLKIDIENIIGVDVFDFKKEIITWAQELSQSLAEQAKNLALGVSTFMLNLLVLIFSLYYFFKDGDQLLENVKAISPLPTIYESELFKKIASIVKAVIFGVFFTAIIQGIVGGIGFAIVGVSNPIFWGTAMAFFSLVPFVGTAVIWFPASIILAILGNYGGAIFIFIWGVLAVGCIDNLVRPYLIGGKAHTYPLITFIVVLGGVMTIGIKGVIVGPLVLMLLMSLLHIYQAEYNRYLNK